MIFIECYSLSQRKISNILIPYTPFFFTYLTINQRIFINFRLSEEEEKQLRAAIERVIRIFKSRLFQVRYLFSTLKPYKIFFSCQIKCQDNVAQHPHTPLSPLNKIST